MTLKVGDIKGFEIDRDGIKIPCVVLKIYGSSLDILNINGEKLRIESSVPFGIIQLAPELRARFEVISKEIKKQDKLGADMIANKRKIKSSERLLAMHREEVIKSQGLMLDHEFIALILRTLDKDNNENDIYRIFSSYLTRMNIFTNPDDNSVSLLFSREKFLIHTSKLRDCDYIVTDSNLGYKVGKHTRKYKRVMKQNFKDDMYLSHIQGLELIEYSGIHYSKASNFLIYLHTQGYVLGARTNLTEEMAIKIGMSLKLR